MTKNKKAKQAARLLSRSGDMPYTVARRLTNGGSTGVPPTVLGAEDWDDFEPKSLEELVAGAPQSECDRLVGEPIRPRGMVGGAGVSVDLEVPSDMMDPCVHEVQLEDSSTVINVADEYEGGTLACNVTTRGTLTVEALMSKADAIVSESVGIVRIFEADFNRHYSAVLFDVEVEVEFLAILNPEYEGVEDFTFDGAVALGP